MTDSGACARMDERTAESLEGGRCEDSFTRSPSLSTGLTPCVCFRGHRIVNASRFSSTLLPAHTCTPSGPSSSRLASHSSPRSSARSSSTSFSCSGYDSRESASSGSSIRSTWWCCSCSPTRCRTRSSAATTRSREELIGAGLLLVVNYIVVRFLFLHPKIDKIAEGDAVVLVLHGEMLGECAQEAARHQGGAHVRRAAAGDRQPQRDRMRATGGGR